MCGVWVLATHGATRPWPSPVTGIGGFSTTAVPVAVSVAILCLAIAGVLFVAQSYVGALISPTTPAELAANPELEGAAYYNAVGTGIGP